MADHLEVETRGTGRSTSDQNAGSLQTKAIKSIPDHSRMIMTGTPIENHLGDLWSLFDFSAPGLLGSASEFKRFISNKDERARSRNLAALRKLIQPYVLRRMKTDPRIVPDLPDKTEMRVDCNLSTLQAALYRKSVSELETPWKSPLACNVAAWFWQH